MAFPIEKTALEKIEMQLGRPIGDEGDTLSSYQQISQSDLNDLRLLARVGSIDATNYLLYRLGGKGGLRNATSYINWVVKGDMSPNDWIADFYKPA